MADTCVVEMKGIVKKFPGVLALDQVDFQLRPGEVHVLLGENGAGKSTLIKVLSGAYVADEGEIWVNGRASAYPFPSGLAGPGDALHLPGTQPRAPTRHRAQHLPGH